MAYLSASALSFSPGFSTTPLPQLAARSAHPAMLLPNVASLLADAAADSGAILLPDAATTAAATTAAAQAAEQEPGWFD